MSYFSTESDISEQPAAAEPQGELEFESTSIVYGAVETPETDAVEDILGALSTGLTLIFCSSEEFASKALIPGKHLDTLIATLPGKAVALVCVTEREFPKDLIAKIQSELPEPEDLVATYYGKDVVAELFALRIDRGSKGCSFSILESTLSSSFFPFF